MNTVGTWGLATLVILVFGVGIWYFVAPQLRPVEPAPTPPPPPTVEYRAADIGISLRYPDTYQLEEKDLSTGQRKHTSVILTRKEDLPPPQNGEGPPTITIDAYQNDIERYPIDVFIRNTNFTNFKLSPDGAIASSTVNGEPAASFRWSGLYEGRTVVVVEDAWVYTFSVTYLIPQDEIILDFEAIMDTVEFAAPRFP